MKTVVWNKLSTYEKKEILMRPLMNESQDIRIAVSDIISNVKKNGDQAVINYNKIFDGIEIENLEVTKEEVAEAEKIVDANFKTSLKIAANNIKMFHIQNQYPTTSKKIMTSPGVECWYETRPIENVGLYIPGGTAPLPSTALMLAIPAKIAGCQNIVAISPVNKQGKINPYILYALNFCGVNKIFKAGGAHGIAALAFGTESIPKVDKIFGPGNRYVTECKQQCANIANGAALDMPAGPSEVMVIADESSEVSFIAYDLLSQSEHGPDSQSILITDSMSQVEDVKNFMETWVKNNSRADILKQSLLNTKFIITDNKKEILSIINEYAPEHLIIHSEWENNLLNKINNAGSIFLGPLTAESFGDYASGTNHVLPTAGWAKTYSGLSVNSFCKSISFQRVNEIGLNLIGPHVMTLAEVEGLKAHSEAIKVRLELSTK